MSTALEIKHCEEVLNKEILIGAHYTKDNKYKRFTFNTWKNEYSIWVGGEYVDGGQAIEELLNEYNEL